MKRKTNIIKKHVAQKFDVFAFNFFTRAIKPFSRFSRRVFEISKIRQIFGLLMISSFLSITVLPSSFYTVQTKIDTNLSEIQLVDQEIVKTKQSIRLPIDSFIISQGFSFFHSGIDLAGTKGAPAYPIMEGELVLVKYGRFGYGNYVLVNHGSGRQSLYAHLAKIEVKEKEKVTHDSILGLIGSTGWSTGPHLHLQVMEDGHWINPKVFFESYFGQRLASTR